MVVISVGLFLLFIYISVLPLKSPLSNELSAVEPVTVSKCRRDPKNREKEPKKRSLLDFMGEIACD